MKFDLDNIKVGDMVAIRCEKVADYGSSPITYYTYGKIARITPKRTKFVLESGVEIISAHVICPITAETDRINELYQKRQKIESLLYVLTENNESKLRTENVKEDDLDIVLELLFKLSKIELVNNN